jgi:hypothetical protein
VNAEASTVVPAVVPAPVAGSIPCGYCLTAFKPNKPWQLYCSAACRTEGNARRAAEGMRGKVASVRPMKGGRVSLTLHIGESERDRVLKLEPGKQVGIVADG